MSNYKDLTGMKFSRLTVIRRHGTKIEGYAHSSISRILKREGMDFTINRIRERLKLMEERRTA